MAPIRWSSRDKGFARPGRRDRSDAAGLDRRFDRIVSSKRLDLHLGQRARPRRHRAHDRRRLGGVGASAARPARADHRRARRAGRARPRALRDSAIAHRARGVTSAVDGLAAATDRGTQFVFGHLGGGDAPYATRVPDAGPPFIFAFRVLPLILVISALSALLWHWKILEWITRGFGMLFERTLGIGGAPALAAAANVFMGMVESSIVIRAYLSQLTRADLFLVMVVGLATAAGSTMVAYASCWRPCCRTRPATCSRRRSSRRRRAFCSRGSSCLATAAAGAGERYVPDLRYDGAMDALACGIRDGVMMAVYVAAYLIVVVAFVWILNGVLALAPPVAGAAVDAPARRRMDAGADRLRHRRAVARSVHGGQHPRHEALPHRVHRVHRARRASPSIRSASAPA